MKSNGDSPKVLQEHIANGGAAVVLQPGMKGDMLTIYDGEHYMPLLWAHDIPATLGGAARFNVQNAIAAAAIAYGMGVPVETIRQALRSFVTSYGQNPGRLNVYDGHSFRVILDYAHNPDGMTQFMDMVAKMRPRHNRVIAVTTGTGDRRDEDIREVARIVGRGVDEMIVKETTLLRGRKSGEIPRLVKEGAMQVGLTEEQISFVELECEAVKEALRRAQPNDLILVFCDNYDVCWKSITDFGMPAEPAESTGAVVL